MSANLYIVRHGKMNRDASNRAEYLHLDEEGKAFGFFLENHFRKIYFDHILYQTVDTRTMDPYNICQNTIRGMKGVKSQFDKTQLSRVFEGFNESEAAVQNILICFRAEAFNVISNIISPASTEEFNNDFHRIFHYQFKENQYRFIGKLSAELPAVQS